MAVNYQDARNFINSFDDPYITAIRDKGQQTWGLDPIRRLLADLGDPHLRYPTIHIAGTKGKGSTSALIANGLSMSGLKTGLYTSPHLMDWRDRIRIDGDWIAPAEVASAAEYLARFASPETTGITAFEVTTALAFWHFAQAGVDAAVIEVGLGGRLDATSIVQPALCVITSISLDHTQLLGDTLAEIAGEKAAIIKPNTPVISAPQRTEALQVIQERAAAQNSNLEVVGRDWVYESQDMSWDGSTVNIGRDSDSMEQYRVGLTGIFQAENAATAVAALTQLREIGIEVSQDGIRQGLANTRWPGRLEILREDPPYILDSAHNPYSIGKLAESLKALAPSVRWDFVFGAMADKDLEGMLGPLYPIAESFSFVAANNERAASEHELMILADTFAASSQKTPPPTLTSGTLETIAPSSWDSGRPVCVTGSLALVGEARKILLNDSEDSTITDGKTT